MAVSKPCCGHLLISPGLPRSCHYFWEMLCPPHSLCEHAVLSLAQIHLCPSSGLTAPSLASYLTSALHLSAVCHGLQPQSSHQLKDVGFPRHQVPPGSEFAPSHGVLPGAFRPAFQESEVSKTPLTSIPGPSAAFLARQCTCTARCTPPCLQPPLEVWFLPRPFALTIPLLVCPGHMPWDSEHHSRRAVCLAITLASEQGRWAPGLCSGSLGFSGDAGLSLAVRS